jgi:hypothetical protein
MLVIDQCEFYWNAEKKTVQITIWNLWKAHWRRNLYDDITTIGSNNSIILTLQSNLYDDITTIGSNNSIILTWERPL